MRNRWLFLALVLIIAAALLYFRTTRPPVVADFDECAAAGYAVMESYPEKCRTPDGQSFTRDIGDEMTKAHLVRVTSLRPGDKVSSPLVIQGEARGVWFFEASFPVKIFDDGGNQLAEAAVAQAKGEWMTEDFVPFEAELNFVAPAGVKNGNLVLEKDNPSGLPEHADSFRLPVRFR